MVMQLHYSYLLIDIQPYKPMPDINTFIINYLNENYWTGLAYDLTELYSLILQKFPS